ncbi:MAG TPA: hypothetical protein VMJ66_11790 [Geobacteraceae bacterium]|nr:hypothetical protein [Geobacteraceae bacterium]
MDSLFIYSAPLEKTLAYSRIPLDGRTAQAIDFAEMLSNNGMAPHTASQKVHLRSSSPSLASGAFCFAIAMKRIHEAIKGNSQRKRAEWD